MAAGWDLVTRKTNHLISWWGLLVAWPSGRGDVVQSHGQRFSQPCLHNETSIKTLHTEVQWSFLVDKRIDVPEGCSPWLHSKRAWNVYIWEPSRLNPLCTLYLKKKKVSLVLSWVVWVILANYQNCRGHENSQIYNQKNKRLGDPWNVAGVWREGSFVGDFALCLWKSVCTPGG